MHSNSAFLARAIAVPLCCCVLFAQAVPQQNIAQDAATKQGATERGPNFGRPVAHPEELSGIWESPDGHGGAIGLTLILDTTASADATTLVGVRQAWESLIVGIYERAGAEIQFGEANYFTDTRTGGRVRYENGRLALHYADFDLELEKTPADSWRGRVHRDGFDANVTLTRPGAGLRRKMAWLAGTWKSGHAGSDVHCLHLAEVAPGQFTGWTDEILTLGSEKYPPNLTKPTSSLEQYGELAKVHLEKNGNASIETHAYSPGCCTHLFGVTPIENGSAMIADWKESHDSPYRTVWKRMPGGSCIVP
jgi:hypothetical protein